MFKVSQIAIRIETCYYICAVVIMLSRLYMKKTLFLTSISLILFSCEGEKKSNANGENTAPVTIPADINTLLDKNTCLTCHKADEKLIGPSFKDIAQKGYSDAEMVHLMFNPKPENWPGYPPMTPPINLQKEDAEAIAKWINSLK